MSYHGRSRLLRVNVHSLGVEQSISMAFEKSAEVVVGMVPKDRINQAKEPASSVLWREESQQMIGEQESQAISHEVRGEVGNQSAQIEERQSTQAQEQMRALTHNLMEGSVNPRI